LDSEGKCIVDILWLYFFSSKGYNFAYKMPAGNSKGKIPFRITRHKEDNIKMVLKEIGWKGVD
jgi:hypothetical protein